MKRLFEGLPVVDATRGLALHVTSVDIKGASKKNPAMCAAARAGQRELKTDVRVFISRTYVKKADHWVRYKTPESASREIVSFDRGSSFEPGEYIIRPLPESERLGQYKGKSTQTGNGKKRNPSHVTAMIRERSKYDAAIAKKKK